MTIRLPDGTELPGSSPIVLIGPNGSGKTKQSRAIQANCGIEFVNALRNTRIQTTLPAMAVTDAQSNYLSQKNQARSNYWDLTSEFDFLLAQQLAEHATAAIRFMDAVRAGEDPPHSESVLQRIRDLWSSMFPGRQLLVEDYRPTIRSTVVDEIAVTYSAQTMSDGEKAALYLAGRVLSADPGILVVDEPETHLHSMLAVRVWDVLEAERPDLRFVYITHDLTFAMSRRDATYVLASPTGGLRPLELGVSLPDDVAEVLLGTASFSFYAKRIILCEGDEGSLDVDLYRSWCHGRDTVVRPVGSCEMVLRCVSALDQALVAGLTTVGVIDRDFHPSTFIDALPAHVFVLPVHEAEALYSLPSVVGAVADHLAKDFDPGVYVDALRAAVTHIVRHKVILERWKRRLEPQLEGLLSSVKTRADSIDEILNDLPTLFDYTKWAFSPEAVLQEEKSEVERIAAEGGDLDVLRVFPGKAFLAIAAQAVGMVIGDYVGLINSALVATSGSLDALRPKLEVALHGYLPDRVVVTPPA